LTDPRISFGLQVRRIRKQKGWTQENLADACDLDRTYIGGIERGERNVALMNIVRLAEALDVLPSDFFSARNDENH
jgi:transcriptional regulator with XRE-family HTH domain